MNIRRPGWPLWAALIAICGACGKQSGSSFIFSNEVPPQAPVITAPSSAPSFTTYTSTVRIEGCFNPKCTPVSRMTVQATGTGQLSMTDSGFKFDADLVNGETRTFSFTATNGRGDVSPSASITITYQALVEIVPQATLYHGGASGSVKTNGGFVLNYLTTMPSLPAPITAGGFVLTAGGLSLQ